MRKYKRPSANAGAKRRISNKMVIGGVTLGVLVAGTGISLAATQSASTTPVTCIVLVDAAAAVDANSALSDVFPVGTALHLTSGGREVDVNVSAALTAAAAPDPSDSAAPAPSDSAPASTGTGNSGGNTGNTGGNTGTGGGKTTGNNGGGKATGNNGGKTTGNKNRHRRPAIQTSAEAAAVAKVAKSTVKANDNQGVDPNSVCVKLSKNAFNSLGNVSSANNVGAFVATMTATGNNGGGNAGGGNAGGGAAGGNGNASADPSDPAATDPSASDPASAPASTGASSGAGKGNKHHHPAKPKPTTSVTKKQN